MAALSRRRPRGAGGLAAEALGEDAGGASDSDASRAGRDEADAKGSDSGSACSVDTDVDSAGEAVPKPKAKLGRPAAPEPGIAVAALESDSASSAAEEEVGAEEDAEMDGAEALPRGPRVPIRTWTVLGEPLVRHDAGSWLG